MLRHGTIESVWVDNVLQLNVYGPFNLQGITEAFIQFKQFVKASNQSKWFRLEVLDDETLGSPDVMKVIGQSYVWSFEHDCQFIAVVCSNGIQRSLLDDFISHTGLNIKSFYDEEQAKKYISGLTSQ